MSEFSPSSVFGPPTFPPNPYQGGLHHPKLQPPPWVDVALQAFGVFFYLLPPLGRRVGLLPVFTFFLFLLFSSVLVVDSVFPPPPAIEGGEVPQLLFPHGFFGIVRSFVVSGGLPPWGGFRWGGQLTAVLGQKTKGT